MPETYPKLLEEAMRPNLDPILQAPILLFVLILLIIVVAASIYEAFYE